MFPPAFTGSGASVLLMLSTGLDDTVVVMAAPLVAPVSLLSTAVRAVRDEAISPAARHARTRLHRP